MYRHLHRRLCCEDCFDCLDWFFFILFCLSGEIRQTSLSFCKFLNFIPSLISFPFPYVACNRTTFILSIYALLLMSSEFQVEKCEKNLFLFRF